MTLFNLFGRRFGHEADGNRAMKFGVFGAIGHAFPFVTQKLDDAVGKSRCVDRLDPTL